VPPSVKRAGRVCELEYRGDWLPWCRLSHENLRSDECSGLARDAQVRNHEVILTYATVMTIVPNPANERPAESAGSMLARIRCGDVAAFEEVFRSSHGALVAFATRHTESRERAEELVQDLFLDLWRERASWQVRGTLRSYLFGALRNRALNLRRRDIIERGWTDDTSHDAVHHLHVTPARVDERMIADEQSALVEAAFSQLPERCRLAMHLRWREGMQYSEIAEVLGITAKSVENHLARGLKALRARVLAP